MSASSEMDNYSLLTGAARDARFLKRLTQYCASDVRAALRVTKELEAKLLEIQARFPALQGRNDVARNL